MSGNHEVEEHPCMGCRWYGSQRVYMCLDAAVRSGDLGDDDSIMHYFCEHEPGKRQNIGSRTQRCQELLDTEPE